MILYTFLYLFSYYNSRIRKKKRIVLPHYRQDKLDYTPISEIEDLETNNYYFVDLEINKPLISQLVRSSTSIGANYGEADSAVSKKDFKNKIGFCRKEGPSLIISLSEKRLKRKGLTAPKESGPPRFRSKMPVDPPALLFKVSLDTLQEIL